MNADSRLACAPLTPVMSKAIAKAFAPAKPIAAPTAQPTANNQPKFQQRALRLIFQTQKTHPKQFTSLGARIVGESNA